MMIDSPTYKFARWLSYKYHSFQKFKSLEMKNVQDLVDKIKNLQLNSEEDWFH